MPEHVEYPSTIVHDLQNILGVIRAHLDMDISFISEFSEQGRSIRHINSRVTNDYLKLGDYDPKEAAYCHKIICGELPEIIPDTALNAITRELPITRKLNIGSYIGVPVRVSDGSIYGTLCCYSHEADSSLSQRDLSLMHVFADLASKQIEVKIAENKLRSEKIHRITAALDAEFFDVYFQPIYDLKQGKTVGFEVLSRFFTEPYRSPDIWFKEAAAVGLGEALEIVAIKKGLNYLKQFPKDYFLSFNASPEHFVSGAIAQVFLQQQPSRIVLEITEHNWVASYAEFSLVAKELKQGGMRCAVDDAGAGYATFRHLLELDVDIIKLDISLIHGIDSDSRRQALAAAMITFARSISCEIIAEGVETEAELDELKRLGVNWVQGYFIGIPMPVSDALNFQPASL